MLVFLSITAPSKGYKLRTKKRATLFLKKSRALVQRGCLVYNQRIEHGCKEKKERSAHVVGGLEFPLGRLADVRRDRYNRWNSIAKPRHIPKNSLHLQTSKDHLKKFPSNIFKKITKRGLK